MNRHMRNSTLLTISAAGLLAGGLALAAGDAPAPGKDDTGRCAHQHGKYGHGPDGMRMGGPGMGMGMGMPGEMLLGRMGDELKLTDDQRTKIRGIVEGSRPEMDRLRDEMRSVGARIADANPDDKGYDGTIAQSARRMGELTTQMIERTSAVRAQVHAVLTPEQKVEAEKMKARMIERWKERRESRDERRGPPGMHGMHGDGPPPPPAPPAADDSGKT